MPLPRSPIGRLGAGALVPVAAAGYLVRHRELRRYAVLPALLTLAGLLLGAALLAPASGPLLSFLWAEPQGALAAAWWLARAALWLSLVYLCAVVLPVVIAAPVADRLSARVEAMELGERPAEGGLGVALREAGVGLGHALSGAARLVAGHAALLLLLLVPGAAVAYPFAAFLWTARWTAFEFVSLPMARRMLGSGEVRRALRAARPAGLGMGAVLAALFLVPFLNLLAVPLGAVSGTLLHCELVRAGVLPPARGGPPASPPGAAGRGVPR